MADFARQYMISGPEDCQSISASVASRIEAKTLKFTDFIVSVQEYALDEDLTIQAKSIEYIAAVLASFKLNTLPRIEISMLVSFLQTRIEDNAGVKEAAQGVRSLIDMTRFIKKDAIDIMETLFKNTANLQRQPALGRFAVYQLVEKALERCREVLQGMGDRFVDGLLSLIEFEKDPRNLMVVFSSLRVVMAEFSIMEGQTEALWDAVFRYYPISYNPKPEDKVQVTKQDLQQRLDACITSNSRFATFALPSLLAKLDQEIGVTVKIETLKTISACIKAYSPIALNPYLGNAWDLIKYEAYSEMDTNSALQAAMALKSIIEAAFTSSPRDHDNEHQLLQRASKDVLDNMETPTQESSRKASLIVTAVASGSTVAYSFLLKSIIPPLLTIYQDADGKISATAALLKLFNRILDDTNFRLASAFYTPPDYPMSLSEREIRSQKRECVETLAVFKDKLVELYDIALKQQEPSVQVTALQGLVKLAKIPCILYFEEINMIVQSLLSVMLAADCDDELRAEAILGLGFLSSITENDVRNTFDSGQDTSNANGSRDGAGMMEQLVFPTLLAAAPLPVDANGEEMANQESNDLHRKIGKVYHILAAVSYEEKVFDAFLRVMKEQLEKALNSSTIKMVMIVLLTVVSGLKKHTDYFQRISGNLRFALNGSLVQYNQFVKDIFSLVVVFNEDNLSITPRKYPNITIDDNILDCVGRIAMLVFRAIQAPSKSPASEIFTLFVTGSNTTATEVVNKLQGWQNKANASSDQRRIVILTKYLLASLQRAPELLTAYDLNKLATNAIREVEMHGETDSLLVGSSFQEILGILVNKFNIKTLVSESNDKEPLEMAIRVLLATSTDGQLRPIIMLAFEYATALVRKGDDTFYTGSEVAGANDSFLNHLITLLGEKGGELIAVSFGHLLEKSATLNRKNHALTAPTFTAGNYKKKLWKHFYPEVVKLFDSSRDPITQKNCLIALTSVISHITEEKFVLESNPISFMLRALDLPMESGCKRAAIGVVASTVEKNPEALSAHYNSIMNRLIACMKDDDPIVRALALACTGYIPSALPARTVLHATYKRKVLRALDAALGDPKAKVRTEAVDCRMNWFSMDESSDE